MNQVQEHSQVQRETGQKLAWKPGYSVGAKSIQETERGQETNIQEVLPEGKLYSAQVLPGGKARSIAGGKHPAP